MERRDDFWLPQLCYSAMRAKAKRLLRLLCRTTAKEKSRRKADTFSCAYEAAALIFRAAVSFRLS